MSKFIFPPLDATAFKQQLLLMLVLYSISKIQIIDQVFPLLQLQHHHSYGPKKIPNLNRIQLNFFGANILFAIDRVWRWPFWFLQ